MSRSVAVPNVARTDPPHRSAARTGLRLGLGLGVAAALVVGSRIAGLLLADPDGTLHLGQTYPIAGAWRQAFTPWLLVPVLAAGLLWWGWPRLAARLSWRVLLLGSTLTAAAWSVALALADGPRGLTAPLAPYQQYPHDVPRVHDLGSFLSTFHRHVVDPANGPVWAVHVGGHPPGALAVFVLLDRAGLSGLGWAAALCVAGGAVAVPSVLAVVRLLGDDGVARRAALFVPLAPAALWIASSADALFAGIAAAGLCALAYAAARRDRRGDLLAALGGLALGGCLLLSYGLSLLVLPAVAVVLIQRRVRPLLVGGLVVLAVLGAVYAAGFDWWQGLALAAERTRTGARDAHPPTVWQDRPTWYFLFANPAAVAVCVGPATVAGLAMLRRGRLAVIPAALAAVLTGALLSNLSKGEVERIYLPFAVWLLPFAALLPDRWPATGRRRVPVRPVALAAQLGWAVLIATTVRTWW